VRNFPCETVPNASLSVSTHLRRRRKLILPVFLCDLCVPALDSLISFRPPRLLCLSVYFCRRHGVPVVRQEEGRESCFGT
jgi:hypothetical protein